MMQAHNENEYLELPDRSYIQGADDTRSLDMYLPKINQPYPVYIHFHGGGLEEGSRKGNGAAILKVMARHGIGFVSPGYRMYPKASFPDFIHDAAAAVAFTVNYGRKHSLFNKIYIGGSSAGAYLSMMLCFNQCYLLEAGINGSEISGYVFDSGQPTVHFNVLRERGLDTRRICVDEAAPLYYLDEKFVNSGHQPEMFFINAEDDMPCRREQNQVMMKTLEHLGYDMSKVAFRLMKGYSHCGYTKAPEQNGTHVYRDMVENFILKEK